ncbi:glycosyltransferase [Halotia branconii]|uniref:Glycosyltransferase n=1 Tax=Halotia branconii CENA392 TaxID=1539056 RepID=A0AAJ6NYC1_9CYAN|nr:glycosyltransferase [Halotia branconii]WGV29005.1 glycosyltransferase [Halotia branconii CENA392]
MPKIIVVNNYSLNWDIEEITNFKKPNQTIWGINYLQEWGYDILLIPQTTSSNLHRLNNLINKFSPADMGDFGQQFKALNELNEADLIYDTSGTQAQILSYMKAMGLLQVPIVSIFHKKLQPSRFKNIKKPFITSYVKGIDAFICLSKTFQNSIIAYGGEKKAFKVDWGPDSNFYSSYVKSDRGDIVAIGRTNRDFVTLGLAASQIKVPVHIICCEFNVTEKFNSFGENVKVTVMPNDQVIDGKQFYDILAGCRAIAIPLTHLGVTHLAGLTSLLDALGMGKPVIMTKNNHIDIDIEAEDIGISVELGDVTGWVKAMQWFEANPNNALVMGKKARKLVDNHLNSRIFAERVKEIFEQLLQKH